LQAGQNPDMTFCYVSGADTGSSVINGHEKPVHEVKYPVDLAIK